MYGLLDERVAASRAQLTAVLGTPADGGREVYERDLAAVRLSGEIHRLEAAETGMVFGRIDGADGTALHIGRLGLHADDHDLPLLVDWRAEAARPFYEATAVSPMGLRRRRHLRLDGRAVSAVNDELLDGSEAGPDDVVGDNPLTEVLQARRTGRMGTAVATLQAEQHAIVRSVNRGVTVVQGGPGTGKTVVALHRAAYALYAFPRAAERGVLVLGPNTRFLDYVSQVLPSLGENDVVLATCEELAGVVPGAVEPAESARIKGSSAPADALAAVVRSRQAVGGGFAARGVRLPERDVARARDAAVATGLGHNRARQVFKELLADAVTDALERDALETLDRLDAEFAEATGLDLDRVAAADLRRLGYDDEPAGSAADEFDADAVREGLLDDPSVDRAIEALWPTLTPEDVLHTLFAALDTYLPQLTDHERALLARAPGDLWTDADVPLLDEASSLLDGPPARTYGHVVVDEAQELTDMRWRMVVRRCPARSMTLVGDFAQAGPATRARDWAEALTPHVGPRFDLHTLTVSYRTTVEILATTRDLLTRIAPAQRLSSAIRHGDEPRTLVTTPAALPAALTAELRAQHAAHPGELLGVICADSRVGALHAAGVGRWAQIVPASEARGLEFDGVLVVDPDGITAERSCGERDLYVGLTRATKRLCTVALGRPGTGSAHLS
ncbi:AAA family ATPase [Streptomyces sp. NPDC004539]|uniref:HelD family protein n=1 Tax=Streptomyces sp. NPDC004539 TaxID=3154280 RepID=UPI00339FB3F6